MLDKFIYIVVASAAIFFGASMIRGQLREMDERDQDEAVARYYNFKGRSVIDTSQELKDKFAALVSEIKARWGMTPEELIRHSYRRHGIHLKRLPGFAKRGQWKRKGEANGLVCVCVAVMQCNAFSRGATANRPLRQPVRHVQDLA